MSHPPIWSQNIQRYPSLRNGAKYIQIKQLKTACNAAVDPFVNHQRQCIATDETAISLRHCNQFHQPTCCFPSEAGNVFAETPAVANRFALSHPSLEDTGCENGFHNCPVSLSRTFQNLFWSSLIVSIRGNLSDWKSSTRPHPLLCENVSKFSF